MERMRSRAAVGAGAAIGATVLFAPGAEAATFTVTSLADDGSEGTLRDRIADANSAAGADTVVFQSGLTGTITLTGALGGDIYIDDPLTITGPGAGAILVSGDDLYRIFDVTSAGQVSISGLTLRDGYVSMDNGAALYASDTDVTLSQMTFTGNYAGGGGAGDGGAVYWTGGNLAIADSTFGQNRAGGAGGALYGGDAGSALTIANSTFTGNVALIDDGGALYLDEGSLSVSGSSFSGNFADSDGGAIYVDEGPVTITGSSFEDNEAGDDGGGAYISGNTPDSNATLIEGSAFAGNSAEGYGGGIEFHGDASEMSLAVRGSTVSGNSASFGGGVYVTETEGDVAIESSTISGNEALYGGGGVWADPLGGEIAIRNSTIASNRAGAGVNSLYEGGGIYLDEDNGGTAGPLKLSSTIVADNSADTATSQDLGADDGNGAAGFELGFSLVENALGTGDVLTESPAGSNLLGSDPALGPLADNGGPTQTHAPSLASPAIDHGIANGLATDQRGSPRTFEASNLADGAASDGTDIGAVELSASGECKGKPATVLFAPGQPILGGPEADVIVGTASADTIDGSAGKDLICSGAGADAVGGGSANDRAFGGSGKDKIKGKAGKDILSGQGGRDTLRGGGGKDRLKGGGGRDKLRGGAGRDRLSGGPGKDSERQ